MSIKAPVLQVHQAYRQGRKAFAFSGISSVEGNTSSSSVPITGFWIFTLLVYAMLSTSMNDGFN